MSEKIRKVYSILLKAEANVQAVQAFKDKVNILNIQELKNEVDKREREAFALRRRALEALLMYCKYSAQMHGLG